MRREAPQPWGDAMMERGYVYGGRASIRQLAAAARAAAGSDSPSDAAVHKVVMGEVDKPEDGTINALALALGRSASEVSDWVGQVREVATPWQPPASADRLTRRQREALDALIRVMVDDMEDGDGSGNAAPNRKPPADGSTGGVVELRPDVDPGFPLDAAALEEDDDDGNRPI